MAFSRTAALRASVRGARPTIARPQLWRQVARRGYASGGHAPAKAGGDTLWAVGAVAVTIPSCWYLLQPAADSHGHEDHGNHGESHNDEHEAEAKEESADDSQSEEQSDDASAKEADSEEKEGSDGGEEQKTDASETSDEVKVIGENDTNIIKHVPDAKGGAKKRSESKNAIKAGEMKEESDEGPSDQAAASKESGDQNTTSGKQENLSNTDTKHSHDITNDPEKSKKGEGAPETAKLKGTVDPKRPQV